MAGYQHTANGVRYHDVEYKIYNSRFDIHTLSIVEPIGVRQLLSASQ